MHHNHELGLVRGLRAAIVAAVAVSAFFACGKTSGDTGGSGETHFLSSCDVDADCSPLLSCLCGVCTTLCDGDSSCSAWEATCTGTCEGAGVVCGLGCSEDADCGGLGSGYRCEDGRCRQAPPDPTPDAGGGIACEAGCTPVAGYRVDVDAGCVDLGAEEVVGCLCEQGIGTLGACGKRREDGAVFTMPDAVVEPGRFEACTEAEREASMVACDFADCERPPLSACSREDFCARGGCGGLEYDESGCRRAECASDADCPETERCASIECADVSFCSYSLDGVCQCGGPDICAFGNRCAPVSDAGPRGDWESLVVNLGTGPCGVADCSSTWTFTPDGAVVFTKQGTPGTATLEEFQLGELTRLVNGAELRLAFRDGIPCDPPPTDVGVSMTLSLSTGDLVRDVTGCAISGPEGNVFSRLYDLARQY